MRTLEWENNKLKLIDQTKLPDELTYVYCENYKDVIISFVSEDVSDDVIYELNLYFNSNKKNKGVASILEMDSIVSYIGYRFLSNQY